MGLFKLPTVRIQGKPPQRGGASDAGGRPVQNTLGLQWSPTPEPKAPKPTFSTVGQKAQTDDKFSIREVFIEVARETVAKCINAGIMGESAARELYRSYSTYLEGLPAATPAEDLLYWHWKKNPGEMSLIAMQINDDMDQAMPVFDFSVAKVAALDGSVFSNNSQDVMDFFYKMRTPLLTGTTTDFYVIGLCNPYMQRHILKGLKSEVASGNSAFCFFTLLTHEQMEDALNYMNSKRVSP